MKTFFWIVASLCLVTGCAVTNSPTSSPANAPYTDYTGYTGYTVAYNTGYGNDYLGMGTYRGYGGWASSYYAPGYRAGYRPIAYYGGRNLYRQGYVRRGGRGWRR